MPEPKPKPRGEWLDRRNCSWWRYREFLPLLPEERLVTLGDAVSPLVCLELDDSRVHLKLDFVSTTGSFKDRNAAMIATRLAYWGVERCVVDSSGNAGIACAAYFARAGIACTVYVPAYTSVGKRALMASYGAGVELVDGTRADATRVALEEAERSFYGGHTHSPFFGVGGYLWALEVVDALTTVPDAVVFPVGSGSLLLGAAHSFRAASSANGGTKYPRLYGVQADGCAPLAHAFERGLTEVDESKQWSTTIAEGIATPRPLRSARLLEAVRVSRGAVVSVGDEAIDDARKLLGQLGLCVEPTAAAAIAGLRLLRAAGEVGVDELAVVPLTGSGQKTLTAEAMR
jgi:threonine synthase